jgi:hypothetical protein
MCVCVRTQLSMHNDISVTSVLRTVKKTELTTGGIHCADHVTPSIRKKLALTSPTSGGRSVGIVRLRTKGHGVFFLVFILSGVILSPLGIAATTGLLYQPRMIDDGDCGAIGGMKIDRGNRSTLRKPAPAPLCPPQIPHDLTWARTWEAGD